MQYNAMNKCNKNIYKKEKGTARAAAMQSSEKGKIRASLTATRKTTTTINDNAICGTEIN